ncbi:MAG TPA: M48 family metallopeptidase [Burkholderiaceae bacterium]|jgi:Zn-dependent protease with chaperone function
MNFFEQQDQARRHTRTLMILFVLAIVGIVIAVNVALSLIWIGAHRAGVSGHNIFPHGFFFVNTLITVGFIVGGTLFQTYNLRDGGDAVAQMAGGRLVSPATQDALERRLLNVVEEMAIASSIACPKVYLLDQEDSINAFAAGYQPNEAVVAVTRGTLNRLTRDELQGVIGHEFSHILNGDMRMNVRLIGVLFGIQMISGFGQQLIQFGSNGSYSSRNDKGPSPGALLFASGIVLVAGGYIGVLFGRLIKSAVSREREFLADASSVQFTRNRDGIGGALRKIGGLTRSAGLGSRIQHPNAEQLSHLFLGAARPSLVKGLFATHPPLEERLRRIYGRNVGMLDASELAGNTTDNVSTGGLPDLPYAASGFAESDTANDYIKDTYTQAAPAASSPPPASPSAIAFGRNAVEKIRLAPELDTAVREPESASAVVYALLLGQGAERDTQMALLKADFPKQASFVLYLSETIDNLPKNMRLPLLDLAMPALRQLSDFERTRVLKMVDKLIAADNKITIAEFVLQTVLTRRLDERSGRAISVKFPSLSALREESALLLSLIAYVVASTTHEEPSISFRRGIAACMALKLTPESLSAMGDINFIKIRHALDRLNQLAPLEKPALIKMLSAATDQTTTLPITTADVLRAICAAIEVPVPPNVAAVYAAE